MADVRDSEPAFLIGAVRRAVERSSIRTVAAESGISHGGLYNLIAGDTRIIYGATIKKLRAWYLREWAACGDGLTPEAALYLVNQLVGSIQNEDERHGAASELVSGLERIYAKRGTPRPAWLSEIGREFRGERGE